MIFAELALLPGGWARDVRLTLAGGRLHEVAPGAAPAPGDLRVGALVPAVSNLHSHAFQRAMAGMTGQRAPGRDGFWSWRRLMYRFLDRLGPEEVEAIAAFAYMEMLETGFAAVGEFHYLHHAPGGAAYADPAEMTARIAAAAQATGIGLTHLPVFYAHGGAGGQPLSGGQARFGTDAEGFARLHAAARAALAPLPADTRLGLAPHSLRAVTPASLAAVLELAGDGPVHIHVAEQPREVAEISGWLGARPVEWLLAHAPLGPNWCAIHATHMTPEETAGLAAIGAIAGLCPLTEADLGDGPFDGPRWLAAQGRFGVGSDSNIRVSLSGELAMLEYSQRLRDLARNVMAPEGGRTGAALWCGAADGGARALGRDAGAIEPGRLADLVAIDPRHPALCALAPEQLLDGLVFAAPPDAITDLWSAGRHVVQGGRHVARNAIVATWRRAMRRLADAA
ncbi:formimidoylglutamate deiminase [Limimaricola pyoseonensis]|uniref:Formiminoglutamate deiminase n=1 Tax=Limimaricola pyoseonensis TaxID=521013 RepID=A0A1G7FV85_9RHOB|nr:formimidoylglutamate deiminase [Limimaricola pyoseonensis]SDE79757.1 formiminoglutamate deiminase [Limimaricola pyoseonensis]